MVEIAAAAPVITSKRASERASKAEAKAKVRGPIGE